MIQNSEVKNQRSEVGIKSALIKNGFFLFSVLCFLFSLIGCDAFVRKFTRKPKKETLPQEEMVLEPQEYKAPELPRDEIYRQYFFYWKSWHDELLQALNPNTNHKKQQNCAKEAIKSLEHLRPLLNAQKQKQLDAYITDFKELLESIEKDPYGLVVSGSRFRAERLKRKILNDFSLPKAKDYLG